MQVMFVEALEYFCAANINLALEEGVKVCYGRVVIIDYHFPCCPDLLWIKSTLLNIVVCLDLCELFFLKIMISVYVVKERGCV